MRFSVILLALCPLLAIAAPIAVARDTAERDSILLKREEADPDAVRYGAWKRDSVDDSVGTPNWKRDSEGDSAGTPNWKRDSEGDSAGTPNWKRDSEDNGVGYPNWKRTTSRDSNQVSA